MPVARVYVLLMLAIFATALTFRLAMLDAYKLGRVDTGIKAVTVRWYQHIMEAKRLVDGLDLEGRLL